MTRPKTPAPAGPLARLVAARRALVAPTGLATLADVGLDGPYVSPYQLSCGAADGPVLVSFNFLDAPTARDRRATLARDGYLPEMLFNRVLDAALARLGRARHEIYLTHAAHVLPPARSAPVPRAAIDASMEAVTRFETADRPVIALGDVAASACARFGIAHDALPHPSARGRTRDDKAAALATAIARVLPAVADRQVPAHA
ncbi:Uracil DNA glycosylase superfamily protein [Roseivivax jejudonensis]|uniref:Uracil DNA glycosylase superfamily protein n=1 Tax=Roseivivax jejudonensis TaxID=1529041 RepID=A0A1X6ZRB6_9RHOB|nr:hypothetical protein [Roseivivax jejudonensis]SLN59291.1 Uracil DNA glycosylase superfamily protein [Roseivivax jejudonensis]